MYFSTNRHLPPVVCRMDHVSFTLLVFVHIVLCFVYIPAFVPYVANFSGLSIFDCPFDIL